MPDVVGGSLSRVVVMKKHSRASLPVTKAPHYRKYSKSSPFLIHGMQKKGGSGSKYVWYWFAVLVCYLGLTLVLWKFITHEWGQMDTFDGIRSGKRGSTEYRGRALSQIITHVGSSGTGLMNKYFYRFKNVHIIDNRIKFYYDPRTFDPPMDEHWVDIVSCNATSPRHPTMFVIKGDAQPIRWHYMPIDYIPVSDVEEFLPKCSGTVSDVAFLLQVRYSYNIWHTWNEGIMGIFQTLREVGRLPLALVGKGGQLSELFDGMGGSESCPWIYDHAINKSVRPETCDRMPQLLKAGATCDVDRDVWCREGSVFSYARSDPDHSPLILTFTPESTKNVWSHLYDSISQKQKSLSDVMGYCFSDLIIGKTSTLNFYQTLNMTPPDPAVLVKVARIDNVEARVEAMAVFKAFITSSQREWVHKTQGESRTSWKGYDDAGLERLRGGVGPEDLEAGVLDAINPGSVAGSLREEIEELHKQYVKHKELIEPGVKQFELEFGYQVPEHLDKEHLLGLFDEEASATSHRLGNGMRRTIHHAERHTGRQLLQSETPLDAWFLKSTKYKHETPRPVVTYMSRNFFSRGIANEKDILTYILETYDVTLRVTTFQEPLLEVMDLLAHSDVLFGMHGAGWTNALFMKRGATTMQMYPYGWRLPNNSTVRGYNYREIIYASEGKYIEWVNPSRVNAYFRRIDFKKRKDIKFQLHPDPKDPLPQDSWPGNQWIYQNTYIEMNIFRDEIDAMMKEAGIPKKTN